MFYLVMFFSKIRHLVLFFIAIAPCPQDKAWLLKTTALRAIFHFQFSIQEGLSATQWQEVHNRMQARNERSLRNMTTSLSQATQWRDFNMDSVQYAK